jgi:hypothetical protein
VLTDPIQHLKRVSGECEFNRREIVLKLVEAFHAKSLHEAAPRRAGTLRTGSKMQKARGSDEKDEAQISRSRSGLRKLVEL